MQEIQQFIISLSYEAGRSGPKSDIVDEWEVNHGCCCMLRADSAAQGDVTVVNQIRACMGLPVVS